MAPSPNHGKNTIMGGYIFMGGYNGKDPKIAHAPRGHKKFMLSKLGGGGGGENKSKNANLRSLYYWWMLIRCLYGYGLKPSVARKLIRNGTALNYDKKKSKTETGADNLNPFLPPISQYSNSTSKGGLSHYTPPPRVEVSPPFNAKLCKISG